MPETSYPDYDLLPAVFEAWLQERFDDKSITVQCKNGRLVFNLPDGQKLTDPSLCFVVAGNQLRDEQRHESLAWKGYKETTIAGPADLEKHLGQNSEDPHYCMIYCYLSTFYQIPASFLDFLFSFGQNQEPLDYHMTGFNGSDTLDYPKSDIVEIPKLGRSGREHAVQYLLRSVESSVKGNKVVWNIRQMAVHHTYDLTTGKAFWLNIKANSIMQDRLKESITNDPKFNPTLAKGLASSFASTLMTHLVHIEWCDESWRQCINELEEKIRVVLQKAKTASVGQEPDLHAAVKAAVRLTGLEKPTSPSPACFNPCDAIGKPLTSYLHSALGKPSPKAHTTPLLPFAHKTAAAPMSETDDDLAKRLKSLKALEAFSVEDLQLLHYLGEQLENFRLVMLLNRQTLRDISEHYQDLTNRDNFPREQKKECERAVASFARRVERVRKNLEIRVTQIESLRAWLQEGKTLLEGILQYRSVQVSHIFTESSHSQSAKMERIAYKTEQETISMHIITCVTLAFLPGTFVAGPVSVDWLALAGILQSFSAPMDSGPQKKFCTYVESKLVNGVNGHGETVTYVPRAALENYWSQANVNDVLDSYERPIHENSTYITKNLRHIFSTLVYTGHTPQISWFCRHVRSSNDHHFPFSEKDFPHNCPWSKDFLEHQWKFCPLSFTPDTVFKRTLHSKHILPVAYEECLTDSAGPSGAATLWRVHIQSECTLPLSKASTVVFKTYKGARSQRLYESEAEAYSQLLRSNNEGYITKHFASFSFEDIDKSIIVLEYAEGGSLLDFLKSTNIPSTLDEPTASCHWSLTGVHQDIQLSNILVFPQKDKSSRFDVNFKLADFGLAKIGRTSSPEDSLTTSTKGNRMYSKNTFEDTAWVQTNGDIASPETYANYRVQDRSRTEISTACDMWSLGAVFSDVLVWSITDESGREDYRLKRQEEISSKPHLRASKHDACFHDGSSRLAAVDEFHNHVLQNRRQTDHLSPYMSQLIIESLLTERLRRLNPMQAKLRADEHIKMFMDGHYQNTPVSPVSFTNGAWRSPSILTPASTPTPPLQKRATLHSTTEPRPYHVPDRSRTRQSYTTETRNPVSETSVSPKPPTRHEPLTESPAPEPVSTLNNHSLPIAKPAPTNTVVTVDQVYQLLEQKDRLFAFSSSLGAKADKGAEIMDLPGMQEARSKIAEARGRDQIMLVDNFGSMEQHKPKAMRTARVISYVAKIADDNGMEVFAASETTKKPATCTSSGKVEKAIKKMKTVKGKCNMQKCLYDILNRVLVPGQFRPTSIYIYTDGVWEPGEDGTKHSISRAIRFLDRHGYNSSALMFQFIRFGNDPIGTERLDYLDNQCKQQTATDLYDIVDAKHCDEHVPDIVIGSISRWHDEKT
ncbi:serine threonine kinase [Fusarium napiforme]|uniref:Serine threonine kinase n=1 Tax=Fusarium napiforme TaxID=42672 RepID=A0A8H5J7R4_9HYPO|nr:serine threonine kinase [Fusarium napiforme]